MTRSEAQKTRGKLGTKGPYLWAGLDLLADRAK